MIPPRFLSGPDASLPAILLRREQRADEQRAFRGSTLVSFTMNIPGQRKQFPLETLGFQEGLSELRRAFGDAITHEQLCSAVTGDEALLSLTVSVEEAKAITVALEERHPLGRLWDMDVLTAEGRSLSRTALGHPQRRCLLCGDVAKVCGRSRRHSHEELFDAAAHTLYTYVRDRRADAAAQCALRALLGEVTVTPKPGLVDCRDSGSHTDMDLFTFVASSAAIAPWLRRFYLAGWDGAEDLFDRLRTLGLGAERDMFAATKGVNTHKGLIFSMAILCGALGRCEAEWEKPTLDAVLTLAAALGKQSLGDFGGSTSTAGLQCYKTHGLPGIRGEAAAGFPSVSEVGLPALRKWLENGCSLNDAAAAALLSLIGAVDDTNMIHRGGYEKAQQCKEEAAALAQTVTVEALIPTLEEMNERYIAAHLSPGGCADLLALTLFLYFLDLK